MPESPDLFPLTKGAADPAQTSPLTDCCPFDMLPSSLGSWESECELAHCDAASSSRWVAQWQHGRLRRARKRVRGPSGSWDQVHSRRKASGSPLFYSACVNSAGSRIATFP